MEAATVAAKPVRGENDCHQGTLLRRCNNTEGYQEFLAEQTSLPPKPLTCWTVFNDLRRLKIDP